MSYFVIKLLVFFAAVLVQEIYHSANRCNQFNKSSRSRNLIWTRQMLTNEKYAYSVRQCRAHGGVTHNHWIHLDANAVCIIHGNDIVPFHSTFDDFWPSSLRMAACVHCSHIGNPKALFYWSDVCVSLWMVSRTKLHTPVNCMYHSNGTEQRPCLIKLRWASIVIHRHLFAMLEKLLLSK